MADEIAVSVICNAYNHEKYIRSALEGFVMQKTDFKFEVLVHDDASTDGTADIIREYELKYPEIIKPVYQTENQYSKGGGRISAIQYGRVRGKYIAICEGDDYWIDPLKLQKQYDALEAHPEIDGCAHNSWKVNSETNKIIGSFPKHSGILSREQVILGGGGYLATPSLFYRTDVNEKYRDINLKMNIDYFLQIKMSLKGGIYFLDDFMSCYRVAALNSWTSRAAKRDKEYMIRYFNKLEDSLKNFNDATDHKYDAIIQKKIAMNTVHCYELTNQCRELLKRENRKNFKYMGFKRKFKYIVKAVLNR